MSVAQLSLLSAISPSPFAANDNLHFPLCRKFHLIRGGLDDRLTKLTETALAAKTYTYDQDDRLNGFEVGTAPVVYAYDVNGNRTSVKTGAGTITYTYPATSNRLSGLSGLVTQADTYDAAGNLLKDGTVTYTYDARGRMATAVASGLTTSYAIDGLGQRIGKSGTGVPAGGAAAFDYDEAGHLLGEYTSTGVVIEETVWLPNGGRATPVAVLTGTGAGTIYSLSPDWLDAPHILQNSAKKAVWSWDHLGFGDNLPNSNPSGLGTFTYNLRFPGQYYDAESGLNYNMARDYNPNLGRYVESDPLGLLAGISTYGYANGNPLIWVDPRGTDVGPLGVGAVYGGVSAGFGDATDSFMQYAGDNPQIGWDAMAVGGGLVTGGVVNDICAVRAGILFGTRFGGNTPLLNSNDWFRIGWSQVGDDEYAFRIGGDLIPDWLNGGHINLWPPSWWFGPPNP